MSKAFEMGLTTITMLNAATSTIDAYVFVQLATTEGYVDLITTVGVGAYGVSQAAINPGDSGKLALCSAGGISRLKMESTAYTTLKLNTTNIYIGANGSGNGMVLTSTSSIAAAISNGQTYAASDIVSVQLIAPRRVIEA